jgi:quercetin dioxygenase-like cupin family protein
MQISPANLGTSGGTMKRQSAIVIAAGVAVALGAAGVVVAQNAANRAGMRNESEMKFTTIPGVPTCFEGSVQQGDPANTSFILLAKAKTGCAVPWHWHSASEHLMIVSGNVRMAMVGVDQGKPVVLHAGGFALMPAKHVHEMRCDKTCTFYLYSDGKFDIHYVDPQGKEISPDQALKPINETVATR